MAVLEQPLDQMTTNKAGAAGDYSFHFGDIAPTGGPSPSEFPSRMTRRNASLRIACRECKVYLTFVMRPESERLVDIRRTVADVSLLRH